MWITVDRFRLQYPDQRPLPKALIWIWKNLGTAFHAFKSCFPGGNKILADVGPWLKDTITARFKSLGLPLTIKYIDPTYMCLDSIACNHFYL